MSASRSSCASVACQLPASTRASAAAASGSLKVEHIPKRSSPRCAHCSPLPVSSTATPSRRRRGAQLSQGSGRGQQPAVAQAASDVKGGAAGGFIANLMGLIGGVLGSGAFFPGTLRGPNDLFLQLP